MSSADSATVSFARAIGTIGTGSMAGIMLSLPLWTMPTIWGVSTLAPRDRLHLWSGIYHRGKNTIISTTPIASGALLLASYLTTPPPLWIGANFVARNRKLVLLAAGLFSLASPVFTRLVMWSRVQKLLQTEAAIIKDPESANGKVETDTLIQEWEGQHLFRCAFATIAFTLAVAELVLV